MTMFVHEWKQGAKVLAVWTAVLGVLLAICVFLYPEMEDSMAQMGDMMASMGSFTAAFGMDELNFGTLIGYYAIECGNMLGIGGALFASLLGIGALAKEEK
ncbi:MAG: ABC transporter permease, partial [Clostridia bacterium]|nr:ABC transporter permease [Clostridia bacterium]